MIPGRKFESEARDPRDIAAEFLMLEEQGKMGPRERSRLSRWLAQDPRNLTAWRAAQRTLAVLTDNAAHPEMLALRQAALAARPERRTSSLIAIAAIIVAALALGALGAGIWLGGRPAPPTAAIALAPATTKKAVDPNAAVYATAVGERSIVSLPDGSVATLDTNTELRVAYAPGERGVRLLRGQALFEVAKNRQRPFNVYAAGRRITAVGTKFDVHIEGGSVRVALLEGVVRVTSPPEGHSHGALPQTVTLAAGEVLDARPGVPVRVAVADTERLTSWQSGVLVFQDEPLGQAVDNMNRYSTRHLSLADPKLAALRLNGVFKTGDPERFAKAMSEAFDLKLDHASDGSPVLASPEKR